MVAEPGMVHSSWQWAGEHYFVSAVIQGPTPSLLATFGPLWFLLVSENKTSYEGTVSTMSLKCRNNHQVSNTQFQTVPAVAGALRPLHKFRRGLLWSGQQWPITKLTLRFRVSHIRPGRYLNPPLYFAAYALIQVGKVYISNLLHVRGHFWPASRSDHFTPEKNPRSNIEEPLSFCSGSIRKLRNLFCTVEFICLQSTENNRLVKARITCTRVLYHMAELDIGVVIHTSFLLCSWL
jgi:hypothetical protein